MSRRSRGCSLALQPIQIAMVGNVGGFGRRFFGRAWIGLWISGVHTALRRCRGGYPSEALSGAGKTIPKSVSDLIARYYQTGEFLLLKPSTKTTYRGILERFREEHGTKSSVRLERQHIKAILAAKSDTPSAGNNLRSMLKVIMDHAIDLGWRKENPVRTVKPLKVPSRGFHTSE